MNVRMLTTQVYKITKNNKKKTWAAFNVKHKYLFLTSIGELWMFKAYFCTYHLQNVYEFQCVIEPGIKNAMHSLTLSQRKTCRNKQ